MLETLVEAKTSHRKQVVSSREVAKWHLWEAAMPQRAFLSAHATPLRCDSVPYLSLDLHKQ